MGCGCKKGEGHPAYVFPGYGVNAARANGADLEPIPITPVRHLAWANTQIQLSNGWMRTNMGRLMTYQDYLAMLSSSATGPGHNFTLPGQGQQVMRGPGALQVQSYIGRTAGSQPNTGSGVGTVAAGVDLSNRSYN